MFIIYISGIDGCGKTTQAKKLVEVLKKRGLDADYRWMRWEPTLQKFFRLPQRYLFRKAEGKENPKSDIEIENVKYSKWVDFKKKVLATSLIRQLWWIFACIDYSFHSRKIFSVHSPEYIVVDRYLDDFIIDQACNFGLAPEESTTLANSFFLSKFRIPDLRVFIDLPAAVGYKRKRDGTPLHYLEEREPYYCGMPGSSTTIHVDGSRSVQEISEEIQVWVLKKIGKV